MNEQSPFRTTPSKIKVGNITFPIKQNSIRCKHCGFVCVSRHRHDFVPCACGKVSADGGTDYLKRCGNQEDYDELSVVGD